jgi:hypothetical protein
MDQVRVRVRMRLELPRRLELSEAQAAQVRH